MLLSKESSKRDETLLLQTDLSRANTVIPKLIQWKDVHLPEEWILEGAAPPAIPKQLEPNTELQNVTQYSDGKVKLSFRKTASSRFSDKESCSSIPSLERKFTKVPSVINLPFQSQPRFSTSDIPSTSIRSVDYTTSVPHPIYTSSQHEQRQEEKEPSPPTSPTFSAITENIINSSPITIRKKIPEWKLTDSDRTIESEHPPFRSITIDHGEPPIEIRASPYKIPKPNDSDINLSSIIQQNNLCNANLNTIGKQLTRIENQFQKSTITVSSTSHIPSKLDSDKKLKEPIFKPFQVSKTSQKLVHELKSDFAKAIREQLDMIEAASSSSSKVQIAPDTPQSSKIGVLEQDQMSIASSDIEAFKDDEPPTSKANKIHWELALPTVKTPPDLAIDNRPSALNQSRYNASSVYEWNIDGTSDRAISEILIAGFTGQLKDAVATLILTISLHFIGDPSHLRDKNAELLHNLRCRKLSEFQSYKTSFFTRLFLRDDANHITWKEKFLAGLPTLLGEKVRNSIKALYDNRIPYDVLTYGELVSFVNKEGLKICQDLKLQKRLKWELKRKHYKSKSYRKHFCDFRELPYKKPLRPYKKPNFSKKKEVRTKPKTPFNYKEAICHKCGIKGHTAKYCRMNKKLHELDLEEEILSKFAPLLIESSESESSMSGDSDPYQIDELTDSDDSASSSSESESDSFLKKINILTKDQETFLELVKHISDTNLQKEYLDKLSKTLDFNKFETSKVPNVKKSSYDLTQILDKNKTKKSTPSIQDLQKEIKDIKLEIKDLKEKQKSDSETIQLLLQKQLQDNSDNESNPDDGDNIDQNLENIESVPNDFLFVLKQITMRKYLIKITLVFSDDFAMDAIALFDTGADLNCIREDIVPKRFHERTKERLSAANNSKLNVTSKVEASVHNNGFEFRTSFVLTNDIHHAIILGTPFINLIMPPKRRDKGKGTAKDPEPKATPKDSQSSPPKEKLLSSAMPIKSWIDMIEDEESRSKALSTQEQVHQWMKSISKSLELMLALQSSFSQSQTPSKDISEKESPKEITKSLSQNVVVSGESSSSQIVLSQPTQKTSVWFDKAHSQNILTIEDGFYHSDPFQTLTKFFPKAQSLLASAKTEEEYFTVMQQLLATRSETYVASSSSSTSGDEEPFISLGNENEDDCFGIFSPIKH
ncbi:hypothetical protein KPL71_004401 [Citrus sinensis]|uniref:Uncharacterized protein n=1 Tax=Citrus sinensis TaxID=2711 RepID=A0ACB8N5Q3_CITSI|nr:hypothetical protein KPL71_004401 [Citrus sinensis]